VLVVHRSSDAATLARGLAEVLSIPPADPFAPEIVAVPAKGVERWLAQRLAHVLGAQDGDGVCANVVFPKPARLLDEVIQSVSPERALAVERWSPQATIWPLLEIIDASAASDPWCRPLAQHLGTEDDDKGRRLVVARRLARLFDDYGQSRPEMLRSWAAGADEDGAGAPLPEDLTWQAELWRRLREHLSTPNPAEDLANVCAVLAEQPTLSSAPQRLSVFGASRLSPARLQVLAALAAHRDVHLWLHHASPALWDTVKASPPARRRREDQARRRLTNPLLGSLSRDILELQQLLATTVPDATDELHPPPPPPDTLLGWLKHDLAVDRVPTEPPVLDVEDRSVQVHACHGRTRQVEVLREVIVGLLADDPTLEPRDVLVMCPDVETFAPIIAATFALGSDDDGAHPASRLRVRLADRALRQTNDLFGVLAQLLDLGTARITSSQLLDLAGQAAVRRRFGFTDEEIERLRDWTVGSGVRWGLDTDHRRGWQLDGLEQGTWRAGLDRLLLGVAMEGAAVIYQDVVPLDDVDSADIDLAGRFAELVDRVGAAQALMSGRHSPEQWLGGLEQAVLDIAAVSHDTAWQLVHLRGELGDISDPAAGSTVPLGLADVRALLAEVLAGRPTRASFRTGTLTVCTLVPMRSVPHRVVCLLGLDDGVFPRQSIRDGDDVLARDPWVGERDPRSEDRQLLLDAITATRDRLVITFTGADERTGAPVPPAVPLGELLDALDRTATTADGRPVREAVTTHHPLQPFDPRNFAPGQLGLERPFSFDPLGLAGAMAASGPREQPQAFLSQPLPALPAADVSLADLHRLLAHPARGFLRQRLQVAQTRAEDEPAETIPVKLDQLQAWQIGDRLLEQRLAGLDPAACIAIEQRRGALPPGPLGVTTLTEVGPVVDGLLHASALERAHDPEQYDVDIALDDGTRLLGTVLGVRADVILSLTYSTLAAGHRLRAWIDLLALTATGPDRGWRAVAFGRGSKDRQGRVRLARSVLGPVSVADARATLHDLVALYRAGLRSPLPIPVKTAAQYASLRRGGSRIPAALTGADQRWSDQERRGTTYPGEQSDAEHVLLYGAAAPISALTAARPEPGEGGPGWPDNETDRFGLLARRLWEPLLNAESWAEQ
jgi:exodeoxyribonuclease V gamma subunit